MDIKEFWKSLGTKIFFLFVIFVSAFVGVVGWMGYRTAQSAIVRQAEASYLQTIVQAGEKMDSKLRYYQELANQLMRNSEFTESLFQFAYPDLPAQDRERRIMSVKKMIEQLALSDEYIRDITLFSLEDPVPTISTNREASVDGQGTWWMEEIRQAGGKPVWFPVSSGYYGAPSKEVFAFGQLFGKTNLGSHDYVLLVQIDAVVLYDALQGIRLGDQSSVALFDQKKQLFALHTASEEAEHEFMLPEISEEQGTLTLAGRNGKSLVVYRTSNLNGWILIASVPQRVLTADTRYIYMVTLSAIGVSVVFSIGIGASLATWIGRRLGRLKVLMEEAATGNFSGRSNERGKDEIGQLSAAYDQMAYRVGNLIQQIRDLVTEVTEASQSVTESARKTANSAKEILSASEQIATSSVGLAANAEHSNSKVEEMSTRLQETDRLQQNMLESVQEVNSICYAGNGKVQSLLSKTDETRSCFVEVSERLNRLYQRMDSINQLLEFLTKMARQTTILSLNASIEASRLGSVHSGFRVISEEIRRLSDQSNRSIQEVAEILESIRLEVSETVLAMEKTMPAFQDLTSDVEEVHGLFAEVQTQMDRLRILSQEVASAVDSMQETQHELSKSSKEVSVVAEEASVASQQVTSLCHEQQKVSDLMVALADNMREQAHKLSQYLSRFKIYSEKTASATSNPNGTTREIQ